ncbi:MAG: hypothetical protein JNJ57_19690 [Saprospiraceae bacterium]|nr:hypothetical protein [Saprospiraceae bacterium]
MQKENKEARLKKMTNLGISQLKEHFNYSQKTILDKLETLGSSISTATLSNILTGKRTVGIVKLGRVAKGLEEILKAELDLKYDSEKGEFIKLNSKDWQPYVIPGKAIMTPDQPDIQIFSNGRITVQQKTEFIAEARKEVIEVGARLNSFSSYFFSQNESEYKNHIIALLKKGVHIRSYLLDPVSKEAMMYFNDRAEVLPLEKESIEDMKKIIYKLKLVQAEFRKMNLAGNFEIYTYKHIPFSQFLIVDGAEVGGKMMMSHYLYGIKRADCPVFEISRANHSRLFKKYWESVQLFLRNAQRLD